MDDVKRAVLGALKRNDLRDLVQRLGVEAEDARAKAALAEAAGRAPTSSILEALDAAKLKEVCAALRMPAAGARSDLLERLHERARNGPVRLVARPDGTVPGLTFTALDFETADYGRDSACALALVRVKDGVAVEERAMLLRPPRRNFVFTYIHGITWGDVKDAPTFAEAWPELEPLTRGARFLAAHNASFDRSVLRACCGAAGFEEPELPYTCTVKLAREAWSIHPTKLNHVCDRLSIPLDHHDALSDARACAQIVVEAGRAGYPVA